MLLFILILYTVRRRGSACSRGLFTPSVAQGLMVTQITESTQCAPYKATVNSGATALTPQIKVFTREDECLSTGPSERNHVFVCGLSVLCTFNRPTS